MTDVVNPKSASPDQLLPYHKKISAEGKALMICFISYTYMVLNRDEDSLQYFSDVVREYADKIAADPRTEEEIFSDIE